MLAQLQLLEQTISELKDRYHITATELVNLKHRMESDTTGDDLGRLQAKLDISQKDLTALTETLNEVNRANADLEKQINELCEQNSQLTAKNKELENKNALAVGHAEVIQDWLTKIDNGTI